MAEAAKDLDGLELLAASVVGHPIAVRADARVGALAWSDGGTIHITAWSQQAPFEVLVQAALIAAHSLEALTLLRLVGRPALARRYLAVEARRAVAQVSHRLPRRLLRHSALSGLTVCSASAAQSLAIALGRQALPLPDPLLGELHPGAAIGMAGTGGSGGEGRVRRRIAPMLGKEEAAEESRILKLFSSRLGGANPLADLFNALIGAGVQAGDDNTASDGAGEARADGSGRGSLRPGGVAAAAGRRAAVAQMEAVSSGQRYPEWDAGLQRYRPSYTRVEDFIPWEDGLRLDLGDALTPPSREMRRQVGRLGLGFEAHRHHRTGDEIVLDDLVRLRADVGAGHGGDPRIYRTLRKTRRDLGVLILLDTSASVKDAAPDGRSLQQHQVGLGWQLAGALEATGDRTALYGFHSWGRERVHLLRVKGFDERLGGAVAERLHRLVPAGFTRIGAAVRHAGTVVARDAGTPFKLVVLVTDGLSYDEGYEAPYAEADTSRAIAELRARRIACLCLSVGGDADSAKLTRVFGEAGFLRADHAGEIAPHLGRLFTKAIGSVATK